MKNEKTVVKVCFAAFFVNLILFFVKLYISLSSNSISIFSDGINNLADSMSCVLSAVFILAAVNISKKEPDFTIGKAEQLLSFVLSVAVFAVGVGFAYSSAERLMYPTSIWFTSVYFALILVTVLVKTAMFVFLRFFCKADKFGCAEHYENRQLNGRRHHCGNAYFIYNNKIYRFYGRRFCGYCRKHFYCCRECYVDSAKLIGTA